MIAVGLCAMGGCFAMENYSAVETYWPSEMVDISRDEIIMLERYTYPGGDSQNDVYKSRVYVDLETPPAPIVPGTIPYGYANAQNDSGGWIFSGVYFTINKNDITFQYGNTQRNSPMFSGWCEIFAARNNCVWRVDNSVRVSLSASFSLPDQLTRNYFLRTGQIRQFCYMAYYNERTNIKWIISSMRSPLGNSALWISNALTLAEI